jgi:hypothetical protein
MGRDMERVWQAGKRGRLFEGGRIGRVFNGKGSERGQKAVVKDSRTHESEEDLGRKEKRQEIGELAGGSRRHRVRVWRGRNGCKG